jgi:hypothetical protein
VFLDKHGLASEIPVTIFFPQILSKKHLCHKGMQLDANHIEAYNLDCLALAS